MKNQAYFLQKLQVKSNKVSSAAFLYCVVRVNLNSWPFSAVTYTFWLLGLLSYLKMMNSFCTD